MGSTDDTPAPRAVRLPRVNSDAVMALPPESLAALHYTEDGPADLAAFRNVADHVVAGATTDGELRHTSLELYSAARRRWMYYDVNLNGYWAGDDLVPLPLASVRSALLSGQPLRVVANPDEAFNDWTVDEFRTFLREFPLERYSLTTPSVIWIAIEDSDGSICCMDR